MSMIIKQKERLGLFGGTFNPIHRGHIKAAEIVKSHFLMDRILFIPSHIPPHKKNQTVVSAQHRLQMVKLSLADYPDFIPSSIEIDAKGKSYSIFTLDKINALYPDTDVFFILGIDAFVEIDTWKDYEKVLDRCFFIVMSRPGYALDSAFEVLDGEYQNVMHKLTPETIVHAELLSASKIFLLKMNALDIASTDIRERCRSGLSIEELVDSPVEKYIKEHKLYLDQNE